MVSIIAPFQFKPLSELPEDHAASVKNPSLFKIRKSENSLTMKARIRNTIFGEAGGVENIIQKSIRKFTIRICLSKLPGLAGIGKHLDIDDLQARDKIASYRSSMLASLSSKSIKNRSEAVQNRCNKIRDSYATSGTLGNQKIENRAHILRILEALCKGTKEAADEAFIETCNEVRIAYENLPEILEEVNQIISTLSKPLDDASISYVKKCDTLRDAYTNHDVSPEKKAILKDIEWVFRKFAENNSLQSTYERIFKESNEIKASYMALHLENRYKKIEHLLTILPSKPMQDFQMDPQFNSTAILQSCEDLMEKETALLQKESCFLRECVAEAREGKVDPGQILRDLRNHAKENQDCIEIMHAQIEKLEIKKAELTEIKKNLRRGYVLSVHTPSNINYDTLPWKISDGICLALNVGGAIYENPTGFFFKKTQSFLGALIYKRVTTAWKDQYARITKKINVQRAKVIENRTGVSSGL